MSIIKLFLKVIFLVAPWPTLYFLHVYKVYSPDSLMPTLGIMGFQYLATLLFALMFKDSDTKIRPWKYFRINILLASIIGSFYTNKEILESPLLFLFAWTLIILSSLSVIMLFVVRQLVYVDAKLLANVKRASKYDDTRLVITVDVPFWLNYIPFNLGNVRIAMRYGVIGDTETYNTAHLTVKKDIKFEITFKYKGEFEIGVSRIGFADTLNLVSIDSYYEGRIVKVYPKFAHLQYNKKFSVRGDSEALATLVKKGEEHDMREYQHGDSFKKINWKIYSRLQKFYTKESELTSFVSNRIIIYDNRIVAGGDIQKVTEEKMTETLVSLIRILYSKKEEYKLFYFGDNNRLEDKSFKLEKFENIFDDVSFIKHVPEITNVQYLGLMNTLKRFAQQGEFVIVCSNLDDYMRNLVMTIHSRREKIKFIYIDHPNVKSQHNPVEVCQNHNIPFVHLKTEAQIDTIEKDALK